MHATETQESGLVNSAFTMTVIGGTAAATVAASASSGSATLGLAVGAPVKVYGVPQADGTLKAYVLTYFTAQAPAQ